ncbi:MAG: hypothetical protein V3T72_16095 [Thermoanaerobaculia bacterium]
MSLQATTIELDEIRARLLSRWATVTDGELLGVVIGRGARRKPGTDPGTHRTAVEVGRAILAEAGGLTGFVRAADDRLRERDGVGQVLACVLIATAEVAARYHRDPTIVGDPTLERFRLRRTTGCRMIAVAEIADRYDRVALRLAAGAAGSATVDAAPGRAAPDGTRRPAATTADGPRRRAPAPRPPRRRRSDVRRRDVLSGSRADP